MMTSATSVRVVVAAACVLAGALASAQVEAAEPIVTSFEQIGQICPRPEEAERLAARLKVEVGSAEIELIASSDGVEMPAGWEGTASCVTTQVPSEITGHLRLAALRGLAVLELAQAQGLLLNRQPRFVIGGTPGEIVPEQGFVIVRLVRSKGAGAEHRCVEVRPMAPTEAQATEAAAPPKVAAPEPQPAKIMPTPPPQPRAVGAGTRPGSTGAQPDRGSGPDRRWGWATLAVAGASAAVGGGLLGYGLYQGQMAESPAERARADALQADSGSYIRAGAIGLGIGAGLAAAGLVLLLAAPDDRAASAIARSGQGVMLRW